MSKNKLVAISYKQELPASEELPPQKRNAVYRFICQYPRVDSGLAALRTQKPKTYSTLVEALGAPLRGDPANRELWYRFLNCLTDTFRPVCKGCGASVRFASFPKGYNDYCGTGCAMRDPNSSVRQTMETNWKQSKPITAKKNDIKKKKVKQAGQKRILAKAETNLKAFWATHSKEEYTAEPNPNGTLTVKCVKHGLCWSRWVISHGAKKCQQCENELRKKDIRKDILAAHPHLKIISKGPIYKTSIIEVLCTKHNHKFSYGANKIRRSRIGRCSECLADGKRILGDHLRDTTESFIAKARRVHGEAFDYSVTEYGQGSKDPVDIICPQHGLFSATPNGHLLGYGCPRCGVRISKPHGRVLDFVKKLTRKVEVNSRAVLPSGKELDLVLSKYSLAIEINGVHWHSDRFAHKDSHLNKLQECSDVDLRLLQFTDYEINNRWTAVRSVLRSTIGRNRSVGARKCEVREVLAKNANSFLEKYHIQGRTYGKALHYGLYFENKLVMLMSFGATRFDSKADWELLRMCSLYSHSISGGASRIMSRFASENKPQCLLSYADRRYSVGNAYYQLGFEFSHASKPGYDYVHESGRLVSRYQAQKHKLPKLLGDLFSPDISEVKNMTNNGYYRLWDCGQLVFYKRYT